MFASCSFMCGVRQIVLSLLKPALPASRARALRRSRMQSTLAAPRLQRQRSGGDASHASAARAAFAGGSATLSASSSPSLALASSGWRACAPAWRAGWHRWRACLARVRSKWPPAWRQHSGATATRRGSALWGTSVEPSTTASGRHPTSGSGCPCHRDLRQCTCRGRAWALAWGSASAAAPASAAPWELGLAPV